LEYQQKGSLLNLPFNSHTHTHTCILH